MLKVTFDFDEVNQKILNLSVETSDNKVVAKPKRKKVANDKAILEIDDNKIILSDKTVSLLGVQAGDRVNVQYWTRDNQNTFPLLGKSEAFSDPNSGNKLTKSNTVSFKGIQREVLMQYGSVFEVEETPFKPGMFKLNPVGNDISAVEEVNEELELEEKELFNISKSDLDLEIENLEELSELPF